MQNIATTIQHISIIIRPIMSTGIPPKIENVSIYIIIIIHMIIIVIITKIMILIMQHNERYPTNHVNWDSRTQPPSSPNGPHGC